MGVDWRPRLEHRNDQGVWEPLWHPTLAPFWYETILDEGLAIGELLSFSSDPDIAHAAFEKHLRAMSVEEIMRVYGDDPRVCWIWRESSYDSYDGFGRVFKNRDYDWFSAISGIFGRDQDQVLIPDPFPEDASAIVKRSYVNEDGHSAGCLMVSDILACEQLSHFDKVEWLRKNIPDPQNTRLIFWFS